MYIHKRGNLKYMAEFDLTQESGALKHAQEIIDNWRIPTGETFGEHRKYCDGCPACLICRRKRQQLLNKEDAVAGVANYKVLGIRAHKDYPIQFYYPRTSEIYDVNGEIDRDSYIFLQSKGFKDDEIRRYFGIKSDDWNDFKNMYFPDWKQKQQDYLSIHAEDAVKQYAQTHPKQWAKIQLGKINRHKLTSQRI